MTSELIEAASMFLEVAPVAVMDDVYNCAHSYLCDGIDALELALTRQAPVETNSKHDRIQDLVESVHKVIVQRLDKNLDKLELYTLSNILTVPQDLCPDLLELTKIEIGQNSTDLNRSEIDADNRRASLLSQIRMARRVNQYLKDELALFAKERPRITELTETSERFVKEIIVVQEQVMGVDIKVRQYRDSVRSLQDQVGSHLSDESESDNIIASHLQPKSVAKFAEYCQN